MGWKIIEIEEGQYLSLFLDNLVIEYEDNKITIPLNDIDTIISQNYKLKLSARLLCELSKHNINFVLCDTNHLPTCLLSSLTGNYNTLKIFNEQLTWNNQYKNFLWTSIVKQKISNQANFLKIVLKDDDNYNKLLALIQEIKDFDVSNREGHAAKIYWHATYGIDFNRQEEIGVNWLLNYGYALLRSMVCRSIIKKGLDPRISLFHKSFTNTFALASDLMEIFRIIVDINVYVQYKTNPHINLYESKQYLTKYLANVKFLFNNKMLFLNNAIDTFIDGIIKQAPFPQMEIIWKLDM